jgi:hypothetical protein
MDADNGVKIPTAGARLKFAAELPIFANKVLT